MPTVQGKADSHVSVILMFAVGCLVGYLAAWHINNGHVVTSTILSIVIASAVASAIAFTKHVLISVAAVNDAENRNAEIRMKVQKEADKEQRLLLIEQEKSNQGKHVFTSNDFTEDAQSLLVPHITKARKAKMKVTGQGLINAILKGFH